MGIEVDDVLGPFTSLADVVEGKMKYSTSNMVAPPLIGGEMKREVEHDTMRVKVS